MVRPTLEYSSAVWDPQQQKDIRLLEKVQLGAARYVTNNYTHITWHCYIHAPMLEVDKS